MLTEMVLADRAIQRLIEAGRIGIDPYDPALLQPSSLDVRVDRLFRVFRNSRYPFIDVKQKQEELTEIVEVDGEEAFILHPGEFVLGSTLEQVSLPDDLVARLEGKSSLGRLGLLIHSTAGFIDPGFSGHVTLELSQRRQPPHHDLPGDEDRPALLRPDERACRAAVRLCRGSARSTRISAAPPRARTGGTSARAEGWSECGTSTGARVGTPLTALLPAAGRTSFREKVEGRRCLRKGARATLVPVTNVGFGRGASCRARRPAALNF